MEGKIFHCDVCDCDVSLKCKNRHLDTKKHKENLNKDKEESEDEGKRCVKCHQNKGLEYFRDENLTCNKCLDAKNNYRRSNPEKTAEWRKTYFNKIKDEVYTCPICDYEKKKYNRWQHEKGVGHKYLLELKERGEEMEKPDKISIDENDVEWYECFACKGAMLKSAWASHLISSHHIKCVNEGVMTGGGGVI